MRRNAVVEHGCVCIVRYFLEYFKTGFGPEVKGPVLLTHLLVWGTNYDPLNQPALQDHHCSQRSSKHNLKLWWRFSLFFLLQSEIVIYSTGNRSESGLDTSTPECLHKERRWTPEVSKCWFPLICMYWQYLVLSCPRRRVTRRNYWQGSSSVSRRDWR